MDKETKNTVEFVIACCGPAFVLGYLVFWGMLGHNIPPPNVMGMSPEQLVADYYLKYRDSISIGMAGCCVVALLYLPWSCLLALMMRDENGGASVFSFMELTGGALTAWVLAFCPAMWLTCAILSTSLDPTFIKLLHTCGWFIYDVTFMITTVQLTGLGLYTILNKRQTIFPAWAGWCAIAVGIIFLPLVLIPFVDKGPFMLPGTWNFYIVFGTWLFGFFSPYSYFMLKELSARRREFMPDAAALGH